MTKQRTVTATNTIEVSGWPPTAPASSEFDQYRYVGKASGKERGEPLEIKTNTPYFTLGAKDNSSAEFGNGPFPAEHTYVVGTSLTNFPRRLTHRRRGGWPSVLHIVFQENFSTNQFTNSLWQKHFVLATIADERTRLQREGAQDRLDATRSPASRTKSAIAQPGNPHGLGDRRRMLRHGGLSEPDVPGPQRGGPAGGLAAQPAGPVRLVYGAVAARQRDDRADRPLFPSRPATGRGGRTRSTSSRGRTRRRACGPSSTTTSRTGCPARLRTIVGFKIGHENGTNELGETQYPEVLNIRGSGYYRMTDYDGVMAGSFRPMAADVFGLYAGTEDAPLIPKAYVRLVPRTTPTNETDNSYAEAYQLIRSKTNEWYRRHAEDGQMHFAPSEVASNGCYFDYGSRTRGRNKAVVVSNHGPLTCFSQVSMHWRGGTNINDGTEGHDIDCVMLKKADGEWVTHQVLNPYANIYQRTLSTFASNDVAYLMQQDRGSDSYGFATEAPYRRASSFEITMLDDGGLPLNLDVYENSTMSEIADNVNITCQIDKDIAQGEHLRLQVPLPGRLRAGRLHHRAERNRRRRELEQQPLPDRVLCDGRPRRSRWPRTSTTATAWTATGS